ncbi:MAG TPA: ATP-binding protein [Candidatus Angelobacter sp.]|nr:ATP-binding protein [Candidatus Angelobacter sp.]
MISLKAIFRAAVCSLVVAIIVFFYFKVAHVNPTTVALSFLLAILIVSAAWGLAFAIPMSILSAACFNFFFLPPVGTFTIADTQNWMALVAFLCTSVIASQLSHRARREARNAVLRRMEVERLYTFSQQLLITDNIVELLRSIPSYLAESFGVVHAAIHMTGKDNIYRSGAETEHLPSDDLKEVSARGEIVLDMEHKRCFAPVRMGLRNMGSLGIAGDVLSRQTLEALSSLVAIAIERAGAVDTLMRSEASRESERLRSALLDSITHEFRTPLTAIKASVTSLRSSAEMNDEQRQDLLAVIEEECDRLNRLVGEAVEMAKLDAHEVGLERKAHQISEAIDAALEDSKTVIGNHSVQVRLPDNLPPVMMDVIWIQKVLQHLIENAAKYSDPQAPIFISSEARNNRLITSVADRGVGIDDMERSMIFDKFYRGQSQRYRVQGTGMGLAIVKAIVEAHEGRIEVTSQLGHGSVFSFGLPLAK